MSKSPLLLPHVQHEAHTTEGQGEQVTLLALHYYEMDSAGARTDPSGRIQPTLLCLRLPSPSCKQQAIDLWEYLKECQVLVEVLIAILIVAVIEIVVEILFVPRVCGEPRGEQDYGKALPKLHQCGGGFSLCPCREEQILAPCKEVESQIITNKTLT